MQETSDYFWLLTAKNIKAAHNNGSIKLNCKVLLTACERNAIAKKLIFYERDFFMKKKNIYIFRHYLQSLIAVSTIIRSSIVNEPERNNESKVDNREVSHFTNFT